MDTLLEKHIEKYSIFSDDFKEDLIPGDIMLCEVVSELGIEIIIYIFIGYTVYDQLLGIDVVKYPRTKDIFNTRDIEPFIDGSEHLLLYYGKWNGRIESIGFLKSLYKKTYTYNNRKTKLDKILNKL
jgi:hypothetical protein